VSKNDRLSENKSVALATLDALAKGELDKLDKFLADGAIYTIMGDTPISAPHTKQAFLGMVTQMRDSVDGDFIFTYGEVTAEDDRVCVEAKSFMTTRTGKDYRNEYHILFKIRGGKVLSVKEYSDTKHVMDTFF
jgi:ketosteroid isomerase-like protein